MTGRTTLVLGQTARPEFAPLVARLRELCDTGTLTIRETATVDQALAWLRDPGWTAELVVVLQEFTGEYSDTEVRDLLEASPLSRWVCCAGVWCESEQRRGSVWPAPVLVPARLAEHRIVRELAVLDGKAHPVPLTAGRDEVFAADSELLDRSAESPLSGAVQIVSADPAYRRYVAEVLTSHPPAADQVPGLIVVDLDPWGATPPPGPGTSSIPVLGLMAVPTSDDYRRCRRLGVTRLLPKLAQPEVLRKVARELMCEEGKPQMKH